LKPETNPQQVRLLSNEEVNSTRTNEELLLMPAYKPEYTLFFGSGYFYILIKMFATVYERLVKAKHLI